MTWYYATAIVVAILVGATGIVTAVIKAVWVLSNIFSEIKLSVSSLRTEIAMNSFKTDQTEKLVSILTGKLDTMQTMQTSLQARTIRLEEKVDKLGIH